MSDDVVKRFNRRGTRTEYNLLSALDRNPTTINAGADICAQAKSTILAQANRIEDLEAKLAKAVEALDKIKRIATLVGVFAACERTLAELTGGKDE